MTIVEAMVDAIKTVPGGGPPLLTVTREDALAASGKAEYKVRITCWGMHRLTWRLKRAFRYPASVNTNLDFKDARRAAKFLGPDAPVSESDSRRIAFHCPCGQDHSLVLHALAGFFRVSFLERQPSKLLWRLRDAFWPKDYSLCEILLTAEQAARLAAFLRRWIKDV